MPTDYRTKAMRNRSVQPGWWPAQPAGMGVPTGGDYPTTPLPATEQSRDGAAPFRAWRGAAG